MKKARLLLASIAGWPLGLAVEAILWLGWPPANLIGLALVRSKLEHGRGAGFAAVVYHYPRWLWLYDNDEDGVGGPWIGRNGSERRWCNRARRWPLWRRILSWQFRNPVANLRFTRWAVHINPARVEWVGSARHPSRTCLASGHLEWCWARQGWRAGLWVVRPSEKWGTVTHRIGWGVYLWDSALDRDVDRHQGFKIQPWRRG